MSLKTIFIGTIEEYLKWDQNPDRKSFEIVVDIEKLKKEVNGMTNQNNDEKRFTEEEKKVTLYLEKHKGENLTYKDAVLACLDRSEPVKKEEFSEKTKKYIQEQEGDLKKVEKYIEKHPGVEFREATLKVLGRGELTSEEKIVEQYLEDHKGVSYREAVLASLSESEGSPEDQELINLHVTINDLIYSLTKAEKSPILKVEDRQKIEQASDLIAEVKTALQKLIDKKGKPGQGPE